jgi:hypothetical protein
MLQPPPPFRPGVHHLSPFWSPSPPPATIHPLASPSRWQRSAPPRWSSASASVSTRPSLLPRRHLSRRTRCSPRPDAFGLVRIASAQSVAASPFVRALGSVKMPGRAQPSVCKFWRVPIGLLIEATCDERDLDFVAICGQVGATASLLALLGGTRGVRIRQSALP